MPADAISYTIKRAQEVTGLGKTKLYELINRGELAVVHVGDRTLILDEDIRALLSRLRAVGGGTNGAAVFTLSADRRAGLEKKLNKRITELGLSTRSTNALLVDQVFYVGQLVAQPPKEVKRIPNIGDYSLEEITAALARHRLRLGMNIGDWAPPADLDSAGGPR